jgi:hypothetical protein
VPALTRADEADGRELGVAIANIQLDGMKIPLDDKRLSSGWHAPEEEWRWTDGYARLALSGAREVRFDVAIAGSYWDTSDGPALAPNPSASRIGTANSQCDATRAG